MNCDLTSGLYSQISSVNLKTLIIKTCQCIKNHVWNDYTFDPHNLIEGTRAYKYSKIIKKLIDNDLSPTTPLRSKTGWY